MKATTLFYSYLGQSIFDAAAAVDQFTQTTTLRNLVTRFLSTALTLLYLLAAKIIIINWLYGRSADARIITIVTSTMIDVIKQQLAVTHYYNGSFVFDR